MASTNAQGPRGVRRFGRRPAQDGHLRASHGRHGQDSESSARRASARRRQGRGGVRRRFPAGGIARASRPSVRAHGRARPPLRTRRVGRSISERSRLSRRARVRHRGRRRTRPERGSRRGVCRVTSGRVLGGAGRRSRAPSRTEPFRERLLPRRRRRGRHRGRTPMGRHGALAGVLRTGRRRGRRRGRTRHRAGRVRSRQSARETGAVRSAGVGLPETGHRDAVLRLGRVRMSERVRGSARTGRGRRAVRVTASG